MNESPSFTDIDWIDFENNLVHPSVYEDDKNYEWNSRSNYHKILPIEECEITDDLFMILLNKHNEICRNHSSISHLEEKVKPNDSNMMTDDEEYESISEELSTLRKGHVRDKNIRFYDDGHRYTIHNSSFGVISTTTLVKLFFPPFKREQIANNILEKTRRKKDYKSCVNREDVFKIWERKANLGTMLHANIEDHWNGLRNIQPVNENVEPFRQFFTMWHQYFEPYVSPYLSEYSVYDCERNMKLAGNIDGVAKVKRYRNVFDLFDWKRSASIMRFSYLRNVRKSRALTESELKQFSGYGCCRHLDNCKFSTYQLQLNVYKYMIEKNNNMCVRNMYIVQLYKRGPRSKQNARLFMVANLQRIVQKMISSWYHVCQFYTKYTGLPNDICNIIKTY